MPRLPRGSIVDRPACVSVARVKLMFPYLAMLGVPGALALTGARRASILLLLVALSFWIIIGFRFQVGMDWNNYIFIYDARKGETLNSLILNREPGYGALTWIAARTGGGTIFLNAVSALIFCIGFFAMARRCPEPWIAVAIATPLLVVAFAMSGARQSVACGIIFYLIATWEKRRTVSKLGLILFATLFHFSAIFVLTFVALGSKAPAVVRYGTAALAFILIFIVIRFAPQSMESYSRLYVGAAGKLSAPGAVIQVGVLAIAGVLYLLSRERWAAAMGEAPLMRNLAWGSLACVPLIPVSSVGAYRFALYFWPLAMYVYSGLPSLTRAATGRAFYRLMLVMASFAMLIGWLLLANNSLPWLPYRNWLFAQDGVSLIRYAPFKR
jgi:hypothetical protein